MNWEENKLDDLFRDRLEQFSPEPPPEMWERIQAGMARKKRTVRLTIFRWASVAAILLIAVITGVLVTNRQPGETIPAVPGNNVASIPAAPAIPSVKKTGILKSENPPVVFSRITVPVIKQNISVLSASGKETGIRKENSSVLAMNSGLTEIHDLQEIPAGIHAGSEPDINRIIPGTEKQPPVEKQFTATFSPKESRARKTPSEWKVGLHLSPSFSSYSSRYSASYASSMSSSGNRSETGVGGGVSIQYKKSRRWKIESGLFYSRTGEKPGNSGNLFASTPSYDYLTVGDSKYFSNTVSLQNGQMSMNGPAGTIHLNGTPDDSKLVANVESALGMNSVLLTSGRIYQVFDFMEIPLTFGYTVVKGKIGVEVSGGISTNFVVGNQVFMENSSIQEYVGKTEDIAGIGVSGLVGLGIIYPISKKISLSVEPQASYWLNSLNDSGDVVIRPWRIGVYSGLTYSF